MLIPILAFTAGIFATSTAVVVYMAVYAPTLERDADKTKSVQQSVGHQLTGPKGRRTRGKVAPRGVINRPHLAK